MYIHSYTAIQDVIIQICDLFTNSSEYRRGANSRSLLIVSCLQALNWNIEQFLVVNGNFLDKR